MDFESKVISREVSEILWETEKTVSTAESCTGGRIGEAMIAVPGASKYFKGGISRMSMKSRRICWVWIISSWKRKRLCAKKLQ